MIRAITVDDAAAVVELTVSSGLFLPDDAGVVQQLMAAYFAGLTDHGHECLIDEDPDALAVAYVEPAKATDRTWYLTMIAVHGDHQGQGRGAALIRYVEHSLASRGQRLLLVQTSGAPGFARTREFYLSCGYESEARVRDYYEPGDDMVLFRKALDTVKG